MKKGGQHWLVGPATENPYTQMGDVLIGEFEKYR